MPVPDDFEVAGSSSVTPRPGRLLVENVLFSVDPYHREAMDEGHLDLHDQARGAHDRPGARLGGRRRRARRPGLPPQGLRHPLPGRRLPGDRRGRRGAALGVPRGAGGHRPDRLGRADPGRAAAAGREHPDHRRGWRGRLHRRPPRQGPGRREGRRQHRLGRQGRAPARGRRLRRGRQLPHHLPARPVRRRRLRRRPGGCRRRAGSVRPSPPSRTRAGGSPGWARWRSTTTATTRPPPPPTSTTWCSSRLQVEGYLVKDHLDAREGYEKFVVPLIQDGTIPIEETVTEGLESAVSAIHSVLTGGNFGKQIVRLLPDA
ncbi:hypothetical protein G5V59_17145 [Nocardioides sp. W3-2-3]|nr:hypothetical protein [Nocardioides convexus]